MTFGHKSSAHYLTRAASLTYRQSARNHFVPGYCQFGHHGGWARDGPAPDGRNGLFWYFTRAVIAVAQQIVMGTVTVRD
jgi:hypothetical protein